MAKTRSQLVDAALQDLMVLHAGVSASAEDLAAVLARIGPMLADLSKRRVTSITENDALPDEAFPALVRCLAEQAAPMFGRATDPKAVAVAEEALRRLARLDRTAATAFVRQVLDRLESLGAGTEAIDGIAVASMVQAVLDDLAARRVIVIANEASIAPKAAEHVLTLVLARLRLKAIGPEAVADAEARLASIARLDRTAPDAFATAVLEQLDVWGAGSLALDRTAVSGRLPGLLAELGARNVAYVPDAANVPDELIAPLTLYVAARLAPKPLFDVTAKAEADMRRISRMGRPAPRLKVDPALRPRRRWL